MKIILSFIILLSLCESTFQLSESHHYTNDFTIEIDDDENMANSVAKSLADSHGFRLIDKLYFPSIGHVYTLRHTQVSTRNKRRAEDYVQLLSSHPMVKNVEQEKILVREKREIVHDKQLELPLEYYEDKSVFQRFEDLGLKKDSIPGDNNKRFKDPYYDDQWYLENRGQAGGPVGLDINVVAAWKKGFTGKGVVVCTLDDGIDHHHEDLKRNYDPKASTDLNDRDDDKHDPEPDLDNAEENSHGTRCAGEIAAQANNDVCGVGVAYDSKIGGIRMLDGRVTDSSEAKALTFNNNYIMVYSASWGPRDDGATMEKPHKYCAAALKQGAEEGRNGLGSIFMWATGNGGKAGDCCNADGYVGSIYTLAIGSVNNYAQSTYFTESCPSQLAVIYTGGYHDFEAVREGREKHPILKVVTTDVGGKCTLNFQGTSSAAPMAAGCMALTLQANPNITWRDAQHIIVNTAKVPNKDEKGWTINGAGKHVNPKFGFGVMDCGKMVELAQTWKNVPPQHICEGKVVKVDKDLDSKGTVTSNYLTDGCQRDSSKRIDHLEHVQARVKMRHSKRGAVQIFLTSPAGTRSEMLSPRRNDDNDDEFDFTFMSVHKWGENPRGSWKLEVLDKPEESDSDNKGHVVEWQLFLYGYSDKSSDKVPGKEQKSTKPAVKPGTHTLAKIMRDEQQKSEGVQIKKAPAENTTDPASGSKDDSGDKAKDGGSKSPSGGKKYGGDGDNDDGLDDGNNGDNSNGGDSSNYIGDSGKNQFGNDNNGGSRVSDLINSLKDDEGGDDDDDDDEVFELLGELKRMIKSGDLSGLSHLSEGDIKDVLKKYLANGDINKDSLNAKITKSKEDISNQGQRSWESKKKSRVNQVNVVDEYEESDDDDSALNQNYRKNLPNRKNVEQEDFEDIDSRGYSDDMYERKESDEKEYDFDDVDVLKKIDELLDN